MELQEYIDQIHLQLSGGLLELEIDDETIGRYVNMSLRELQSYTYTIAYLTVPFSPCLDLNELEDEYDIKISRVVSVHRTEGNNTTAEGYSDPFYLNQVQLMMGAGMVGNINNWINNYSSYNLVRQVQNTMSTDLNIVESKVDGKVYINVNDKPSHITLAYIPRFTDVRQIRSEYWIDKLMRLATAHCKIALGMIRTQVTQSNALWGMNGDTLLETGNTELKELRELLKKSKTPPLGKD